MRPATFPYLITVVRPDGRTWTAPEPQVAHSAWSAGAQYLRANPGCKILSIQQLQQ